MSLRYAARRTDPDTARDVLADTFLVVWRRLSAVPEESCNIRPWLYGVARKVLANIERSSRRAELLTAQLRDQLWTMEKPQDPANWITGHMRLNRALEQLSKNDREALRLIGWEELTISEAAVAMSCSRAAMAVRLHRARRRLALVLNTSDRRERPTVTASPKASTPS
ncbi:MAG: RNA polymerase sigma factor [Streptosporangiaceae bacterium]